MNYDLNFSPEFFLAEGEPYDRVDHAVNADNRPISVYSAVTMMDEDEWASLATDVFGCKPEHLTAETVIDKIRETNTCRNLNSPVEVWIDNEGSYVVRVWSGPQKE